MKRHRKTALLCGMLGCICYGTGDWLMIYGDPSHTGKLVWLSKGTAFISQWRFNLAMALAFPGTILYRIALFSLDGYIPNRRCGRRSAC